MNFKTRHFLPLLLVLFLAACAKIGSPDGGPYDETPPKLVKSTPMEDAVNNRIRKIVLEFDENIKLENASEKVVVSPPQQEPPEITASGKKVVVSLLDTLKENSTYTIDFSDAIVDNNEGNPMGNFTFAFSTGATIDSMQVSGTVLNASDLEPIKGILVGLYSDLSDTAFSQKPMERVARTNGSGKFIIKGIAPGKYHVFALMDADQNYRFSQKSEKLAFLDSIIIPDSKPDTRLDTIWTDSIHYDSIRTVPYTHFLPDNLILTAFQEEATDRFRVKEERPVPERFSIVFSSRSDTLPKLRGLNFNEENVFLVEANADKDSLQYWITDTLIAHQDTLSMEMTYFATDSTGELALTRDTLRLTPKKSLAKILKEQQEKLEEWQKEQKKKQRRGLPYDSIPPLEKLALRITPNGTIDPDGSVNFDFEEPLARLDTTGIHLMLQKDTLWEEVPYYFENAPNRLYSYQLTGEWRPVQKYKLVVDSACCRGIYGAVNGKTEIDLTVPSLDAYSSLFLNIQGAEGKLVVQLLSQDNPVKEVTTTDGHADFYFIKPGDYYIRAFVDRNGDGRWTTGDYAKKQEPEEMFYYPGALKLKAQWDITQDWDVHLKPLNEQKPAAITKQKPDTEKTIKSRNAEREKEKMKNSTQR